MGQAIEQCGRHLGVREDARPFTEGEVGGEDDRGALVEPADEVEQELAAGLGERQIAAIENARLLNELRESLQQQTATSEVLGVISSSPGDLGPVFQAMLANARRGATLYRPPVLEPA